MTFDITKMARMNDFNLELKSLGCVICTSLTAGHVSEIEALLTKPEKQGIDVLRFLFGEIARKSTDNASDTHDPSNDPRFTELELSKVTDSEIEEFSDGLGKKNLYIFRISKDKYLEKAINESSSEYFIRGIRHHLMEQRANWERLTKASLGNEYENIFNPKAIHTPAFKIPEHYFPENPIHTTNNKIDGISEIAGDVSKKYLNSLKQNKISSNINICIAALALIVSGISLWIAYDSSKDTKVNNRKSELQSSAVEEKINNITESLKKDRIAIEKVINVNLEKLPKTEKK
jgi:hypothetical protein